MTTTLSFLMLMMLRFQLVTSISMVPDDPDYGLNVMELITKRGYAVEEHKFSTADNYILTMYRLPKTHKETQENIPAASKKSAVYLVHGLLDSSFTFECNFRNQSLAFILADAGYDVWLDNNGTTWSNEHTTYAIDSDEYWNFSWQEMALYDMPAMIQFVLNTTGQSTLSYVGHSEGTMQAFAGFSVNQELAQKVSYFGALSPVAYLGHMTSPVLKVLAMSEMDMLFNGQLASFECTLIGKACTSFITTLMGPSVSLNATRLPVYIGHTPAGTSVKNMAHFAQGIRDNTFRYYDYGCQCVRAFGLQNCPGLFCRNKEVYGTFDPPTFNLSAIRYPRMGFYVGTDDWITTDSDVTQLYAELKNAEIVANHSVQYSHVDFTWGYNANEVIYQSLLTHIAKYTGVGYD
ncbi:putative AB-hydrolase lipase domain, alpha/Beta hydrolase [Plasmopara halstedii]